MFNEIVALLKQDISGLVVQMFFAVTIFLMVIDKQKPPITTSLLTGIALIILGVGGSFESPLVAAVTIINGLFWLILAWQRFSQK